MCGRGGLTGSGAKRSNVSTFSLFPCWMARAEPLDPAQLSALDRAIDDLAEDAFGSWNGWSPPRARSAGNAAQQSRPRRAGPARLRRPPCCLSARTSRRTRPRACRSSLRRAGQRGRHLAAGTGPSLLLNGHIDVVPPSPAVGGRPAVPAGPPGWLADRPRRRRHEGRVRAGRAGRGGAARRRARLAAGPLSFASVIEEECTGNGTLAAARAGVLADAAVLLEPTDLGLLLGGSGSSGPRSPCAGGLRTPSRRTAR